MKLYITYKDDGPAGVCGQTVDTTNPRTKLYVISGDNEEKIRAELKNLQESVNNSRTTRRNARLTDYYWEGNEWEQEGVKNILTESDVNSSDEIEVKFRSWYKEKYGSAYFGSVPLVVLIEWSKTLLNQINPQPVNGWQPISTAPKDGTEIQVSDYEFVEIVSWSWDAWDRGSGWIDRDGRLVNADWWRPLPDHPPTPTKTATPEINND